jgi:hypothetical protein
VLLMLTRPPPDWVEAVRAWDGQRIRKVVRRARGAEWRRAEALPGLTVRNGSAEVRVFPPIPVDEWPRDLARLQVGGTELDDPPPAPVKAGTPLVLLSPDLELTAGKAMAQAAHAAQLGWRASGLADRAAWAGPGLRPCRPHGDASGVAPGAHRWRPGGTRRRLHRSSAGQPNGRRRVALASVPLASAADQSSEL